MSGPALTRLRDRLLELHAEARELREHQVAYHALAAALHAAESLRDIHTVEHVAALARQHGEWIDTNEPLHPLSGQSAALRGNHSVFEQLAATCAAVRARLKSETLPRKKQRAPDGAIFRTYRAR